MKGYCSNSPIQCTLASTCEIIDTKKITDSTFQNSDKDTCPKCRRALIPVDDTIEDIKHLHRQLLLCFLLLGLLVMIFWILFLIH